MKYMEVPELAALSRRLHHHSAECAVHTRVEAYSCKSINKDKKLFASLEHSYLEDIAATSRSLPSDMTHADDATPFGSLASPSARKTLYLLIATLNVAFPDYSFSTLRPDSFVREPSGAHILGALSSALVSQSARPNSLGLSPPRSYASYPHPPSTESSVVSSSPSFRHYPFLHKSLLNNNNNNSSTTTTTTTTIQPDVYSSVHPTLYKTLDDVVKLSECEVFSYSPDLNSDPHAGDSDDEEFASDDDDDDLSFSDDDELEPVLNQPSEEEEEDYTTTFVFDEENVSDEFISVSPPKSRWLVDPPRKRHDSSDYSTMGSSERLLQHQQPRRSSLRHRRPRTPVLWSSNWFFYNRKLKRIVFISIWARKKSWSTLADDGEEVSGLSSSSMTGDTFTGWVGDVGAGARALGLISKSL